MSSNLWLVFVAGTVLCWGAYGPTIHEGTRLLGSSWKVVLCVGAAYFVIAVAVPLAILLAQGESLRFTPRGTIFASIGGALGALGAICIVLSIKSGGSSLYIMPLVFGGAPLVNVLVASALHPPKETPSPWLYVGFLVAALGAGMVFYNKPA
jgi:hypothetical protein